jgi:hypothetical protein
MTTEDVRTRVEENAEGDVIFGRDEVADLLAERDRLAGQVESVKVLADDWAESFPDAWMVFDSIYAALDKP